MARKMAKFLEQELGDIRDKSQLLINICSLIGEGKDPKARRAVEVCLDLNKQVNELVDALDGAIERN